MAAEVGTTDVTSVVLALAVSLEWECAMVLIVETLVVARVLAT